MKPHLLVDIDIFSSCSANLPASYSFYSSNLILIDSFYTKFLSFTLPKTWYHSLLVNLTFCLATKIVNLFCFHFCKKLLQRLEAVRPTRGLSRDSLFKEHIKQKQYSKTASRSRPSSAKSSSSGVHSRTASESGLMFGDSGSVASSRSSCGSRGPVKKRTHSKPTWEAGW